MKQPVSQQKELSWKTKDGSLIPINKLTTEQLQVYRKIAARNVDNYYRNFEFFSEILNQMDNEIHSRIEVIEQQLIKLKKVEAEV
jgi:hypothetical protein